MSEQRTPAFLIRMNKNRYTGDDGAEITASVVYLREDGEVRNYTDSWGEEPFDSLMVTALVDVNDTFGDSYGYSTEYRDLYSVRLRRAETMLKTLRKVERGLLRIDEIDGMIVSFPEYLLRVARILKIRKFGWLVIDRGPEYRNNTYHWTGAPGARTHINTLIREFKAEKKKEVV